ncbi:MAG: hypothetical protein EP329_01080 [Deltaproteobacteria bacterium]|nr:MAG: hypothetical protein EP329_01080 [Deltaproteobacteria bacterium]
MTKRRQTALAVCLGALAWLGSGAAWAAEGAPAGGATTTPGGADLTEAPPAPMRAHLEVGAVPIALSGYFWADTGYMMRENARAGQYDSDVAYAQGRFVLAAEYYTEIAAMFASSKVELIGFVNEFTKSQFEAHVLDAYVMLGQRAWDVQVGRFLAWEVYHRGQGIELFTAEEAGALGGPSLTWLELTRGYRNESGQLAFHVYPTDFLGVEVAGVYGQESNQNDYGVRPVIDFHVGDFKAIAGFEYLTQQPQTSADKVEVTSLGAAGMLRYAFPYVTVGADFGWSSVDYTDIQGLEDTDKTLHKLSVGGFADVDLGFGAIGLGFHYTAQKNEQKEENTHQQMFVSYLQRLPIEGLSLKLVYGYALAYIEDNDVGSSWENTMHSVRLRVAYDFQ